ncbi:hypothetical protein T310_6988, partial [Rasamsonia emersonii CBS 393.64]
LPDQWSYLYTKYSSLFVILPFTQQLAVSQRKQCATTPFLYKEVMLSRTRLYLKIKYIIGMFMSKCWPYINSPAKHPLIVSRESRLVGKPNNV